ncbi:hypothetical protein QTP70_023980 [Hemibagrus guttatus]|uniref:Reverse transcriptase domain-containing protein n=1 Tax=Hemibagrus guttatus TaxID=175788 RepID=A0AAE0V1B7_9TELE|nr:hypothetical protein QTP70_023980 [Hemibagrus guttatus]KAK3562139.1 hypothetical protein QTP86_030138 [Hemibagrus guttatus]
MFRAWPSAGSPTQPCTKMATNSITPSSAEKQRALGNGSEVMLQGFEIPCEDSVIITGLGNHLSSTLILNTGVPQGCVLSPLRYSLFTHDCVPRHNSNIFIKYADDTTVVGRIGNNDELNLSAWCSMNNITLNATKTKELIVDFQKPNSSRHSPSTSTGLK